MKPPSAPAEPYDELVASAPACDRARMRAWLDGIYEGERQRAPIDDAVYQQLHDDHVHDLARHVQRLVALGVPTDAALDSLPIDQLHQAGRQALADLEGDAFVETTAAEHEMTFEARTVLRAALTSARRESGRWRASFRPTAPRAVRRHDRRPSCRRPAGRRRSASRAGPSDDSSGSSDPDGDRAARDHHQHLAVREAA